MIDSQFLSINTFGKVAVGLLAFNMAACSISGFSPEVDPQTTASVVFIDKDQQPLQETVDPSDWETIRSVLVTALDAPATSTPIQWQNEITGSVGTVMPLEVTARDERQVCRKFSTTLNSVGGITQYSGGACRNPNGSVELVNVAPKEAVADVLPTTPSARNIE